MRGSVEDTHVRHLKCHVSRGGRWEVCLGFCVRWLWLFGLTLSLVPGATLAEDAESLRQELGTMRQEFESMKQQYERRMQDLSDRIKQLEAQPSSPTPPAPSPTPAPAPALPQTAERLALRELLTPRQPFATAQPGRTLLFDLGLAGDFVTDFTSATQERRHDGTFNGRENRLFPRHVELAMFGRVDPYASATIKITGAEQPTSDNARETEITAKLETAHLTLLTLPYGTTARLGLMRPRFGTLNTVDEDDLPQVDRPDVLRQFFGEEQLNTEKGLEAMWLLPTPFYQEASLGVFNGDNEVAFGRGSLRDPLVLGRLRSFFEFEEWGGLQVDLSGGTGVTANNRRNTIAGVGLKYKWAPLAGYGFPVVTLAGEAIYGHYTMLGASGERSARWLEGWGFYLYGQYDWTKRWAAGLRYDWSELLTATGHAWALSPYLQFRPSEFLRFRMQYKYSYGIGLLARDANELFLQGTFIMGAHPTERF